MPRIRRKKQEQSPHLLRRICQLFTACKSRGSPLAFNTSFSNVAVASFLQLLTRRPAAARQNSWKCKGADDLSQALEGRHLKPVGLLDLLAILALVNLTDGNGEIGYGDGIGQYWGRVHINKCEPVPN